MSFPFRAAMFEHMKFPEYKFVEYPKAVGTGRFSATMEEKASKLSVTQAEKLPYDHYAGTEITEIANNADEEAAIIARRPGFKAPEPEAPKLDPIPLPPAKK